MGSWLYDDSTLDELFQCFSGEDVVFHCAKWRLDRATWRPGRVPPCPCSAFELAAYLYGGVNQATIEAVLRHDTELVGKLQSESRFAPPLDYFTWPLEWAAAYRADRWGAAYDCDGQLLGYQGPWLPPSPTGF